MVALVGTNQQTSFREICTRKDSKKTNRMGLLLSAAPKKDFVAVKREWEGLGSVYTTAVPPGTKYSQAGLDVYH